MDWYVVTIVCAELAVFRFMEDDMELCISSKFGTSTIKLIRFVRELGGERESGVIQINHKPDATILQFIILAFICSSTCFGRFPPIIRSSVTAVAASGFTFVSW